MSAEQQLARFWEVQDMFLSMRVADSIWPDALFNSAVTSEISPSGVYGQSRRTWLRLSGCS